jgi:uncharacterized membrane protein YgdD (TMEM256/DUF423 family)
MVAAALLGALGVTLGAFGAHGLQTRLSIEQLESWDTAVRYHLLHSVALLALALFGAESGRSIQLSGWLFSLGILLLLTGQRWLGPVTPLGGLCLIAGWLSLISLARP